MRTSSGEIYLIEGYGDLLLTIRSTSGNIEHEPSLSYYSLSLKVFESFCRQWSHVHWELEGSYRGFQNWRIPIFPSVGRLNILCAYIPGMLAEETAKRDYCIWAFAQQP